MVTAAHNYNMPRYGSRDQMNSLPNGRDSHLGEIENDFKDPEDEFWEKNNSVSHSLRGRR